MGDYKLAVRGHIKSLFTLPHRDLTDKSRNQWTLIKRLTLLQWITFWTGWLAWTCDAVDFFAVSLTVVDLQKTFNRR
jgi:SHS family lactate transporter-like MFS transporter